MNKINSNVIQSNVNSELASFQKLFDICMSYIHVSFPAIVEKKHNRNGINYYDVRPIIEPFDNNYEGQTPSLVLEVPAGRNGNSQCGDKWDYNEKDVVWVICADKSITNIMENWQSSTSNVYRSHTLEGSFILCCINKSELQNYIEYGNEAINIKHTKKVNINADTSFEVTSAEVNIKGNKTTIDALEFNIKSSKTSAGEGLKFGVLTTKSQGILNPATGIVSFEPTSGSSQFEVGL